MRKIFFNPEDEIEFAEDYFDKEKMTEAQVTLLCAIAKTLVNIRDELDEMQSSTRVQIVKADLKAELLKKIREAKLSDESDPTAAVRRIIEEVFGNGCE